MPYRRRTLFATPLLAWQAVELEHAAPAWSPEYRVEGPRLLVPTRAWFECTIGASRFVCDPVSALWLSPGQAYRMRQPHARQAGMLLTVAEDFAPSARAPLPADAHVRLSRWLRRASTAAHEPLGLEEELAAWVRTIVAGGARGERAHRAVERAREYLAASAERNDSLADIARAAHCSPFHLARTFRRRTGHSLHGYRTRLRMAQALVRLRDGERNLAALAADLGYASHSHFSSAFARSFGVTPSRMRLDLGTLQ